MTVCVAKWFEYRSQRLLPGDFSWRAVRYGRLCVVQRRAVHRRYNKSTLIRAVTDAANSTDLSAAFLPMNAIRCWVNPRLLNQSPDIEQDISSADIVGCWWTICSGRMSERLQQQQQQQLDCRRRCQGQRRALSLVWNECRYDDVATTVAPINTIPLKKIQYFNRGSTDLSQTFIYFVCKYSRNISCEFYWNNWYGSTDTAV